MFFCPETVLRRSSCASASIVGQPERPKDQKVSFNASKQGPGNFQVQRRTLGQA